MWLQQRLKGLPGLLSSSWARRLLVGLLLFLIFYWYLGAEHRWRLFSGSAVPDGAAGQCLQAEIHRWKSVVERGEGIHRTPEDQLDTPFVSGNGHILIDVDSNRLWVASSAQPGSAPVHQTDYSPRVDIHLEGGRAEAQASMLWFRKGSVLSVRCASPAAVQSARDCVSIREEVMAHRSRPNVYLQRIHIKNPSDRAAALEVSSGSSPSFGSKFSTSVEKLEDRDIVLSSGRVPVENNRMVLVVVVAKKLSSRIHVAAKSDHTDNVLSVVWTSDPIESSKLEETFSALRDGAKKELGELLRASVEDLVMDHQQAWADLFISGVEMRKITDSHTPSSRTVNTTLYYILSSSTAPLLDRRLSGEERARLESSLNYADHCFSGHATMHAENLWPERVSSAAQILQLVTLWTLTLQKRGCRVLVAAGAHGAMQGMALSFGGLQFTENHLQFQADPDVLHNSYALRGIRYNQDLLSLAVLLDGEGKPFLHVSVKQETAVKLYACEAGCLNEPVELTSEAKGHTFPVMVTQPITPLLYISTDLRHLQDLRHTLHLKAILAHEEHMANRYPGLPFLFWFSVASLITLFHLFLFKLIYNEYCGPGAKPLFRSKVAGKREDGCSDSSDAA
ncbi:uncharacterized protein KIAA2013 homolog [Odontesthes bonariensis]|uniref:uncharacterized protein KIAA2013 homolog n=1 Tax=Odontesthes bonariensis TaxID=219752 RepID=UPI003F58F29B